MKITHSLRLAAILATALPLSFAQANFEQASPYIDLDGSMVGYIDFAGDGQEIGTALNDVYQKLSTANPQMPPIPVDFRVLFDNLGFGSLKAMAMSSKDIEPGLHRNRSVALFNGEPTGLFAIYGTELLTFTAAELAPADATGAMSASLNLVVLRDTVSKVMQQIMGPMGEGMLQQQLGQVVPGSDLSYNELIEKLSGRWDGFWMQSYGEDFQQDFKFWVRIQDAGGLLTRVRASAESQGIAFIENEATLKANLTPLLGGSAQIELYAEASKADGTLTLYTDADWSPQSGGTRLSASEGYQALAARLPVQGIAFTYSKGADLDPTLAALTGMPKVAPYTHAIKAALDLLIGDYLKPSLAVSVLDGEAMYTDQYAGYSTKQMITAIPVMVGGGIGAAMAIPAFQKVRSTSQEKAATNNLRQIASASQQYFLETGESSVKVSDLVETYGYIRSLRPVSGENYMDMVISSDMEVISVELSDGRIISYDF